ncbi:MAG: 30S ribosomal protein S4 [Armatimonadetes bacterium]|nr:30S ribosomal protein S4 [Armatimonadota bacterium]
MARYTGPKVKLSRRVGAPIADIPKHTAKRQLVPNGIHGYRGRRLRDYGVRLNEKQKLRYHYGVSESQLRRYFRAAAARREVTGAALLSLLERRLDNIVFRLGFAPTLPAARQLVTHGHAQVNGERVTVPGYGLRPGETVAIRPESRSIPVVSETEARRSTRRLASYLEVSPDDPFVGRVVGEPAREDVPFDVDEAAVVAYYRRRS